jgi:hypothetical protein
MDTGIGYAVTQISRKHQYGIRLKYFNNNYKHSRIKAASPQLEAHQGIKPSWPSSNPNRLISSLSCGSHAPCRQLPHTDRDMTPYREPPLPMPLGAACGSPIVSSSTPPVELPVILLCTVSSIELLCAVCVSHYVLGCIQSSKQTQAYGIPVSACRSIRLKIIGLDTYPRHISGVSGYGIRWVGDVSTLRGVCASTFWILFH